MNGFNYISLEQQKADGISAMNVLDDFELTREHYQFQRLDWRALWFRDHTREFKCYPIAKYTIPKEVYLSRVIVRAGYLLQPTDKQCYEKPIDTLTKMLFKHRVSQIFNLDEVTDSQYTLCRSVLGENVLNRCWYDARQHWCQSGYSVVSGWDVHRNVKTFWYIQLPDQISSKIRFRVLGTQARMSGIRYPPSGYYDDYAPGGLDHASRQTLIKVKVKDYVRDYDYFDLNDNVYYAHPEDIVKEK